MSPPRPVIERNNSAYQDFLDSINHSLGLMDRIRCPENRAVLVDFTYSCLGIQVSVNESGWKFLELLVWHKSLLAEHCEATGIKEGVCGCRQKDLNSDYDEDFTKFPHALWQEVLDAGQDLESGLLELRIFTHNLCDLCISVYNRSVKAEDGWRTVASLTEKLRDHYLPHTHSLIDAFNEARSRFEEERRVAVTIDELISKVI